ncbi:CCQ_1a_G0042810.mRNA.1.CDS.1 [Saccharomyces cerevisiae]|nr:CCQ_1a_G0042810.mRNA.1.CDS.1 [Saccharomyces cerevisiae]CAI7418717.1 CCQ_1a_G0042810.mRNA.1.CDS.1 [Saccharomyces cerevisiae]
MSHPIKFVNANSSDKSHQLGGQYSIPQDLRENLQKEAARIGENEKDVLQEKMETRTVQNREDSYHKRRFDMKFEPDSDTQTVTSSENTQDAVVPRKRKSRWDVKGYEPPDESSTAVKENSDSALVNVEGIHDLMFFKPSDHKYFADIISKKPIDELNKDEKKERTLSMLLLKIKNGNTASRRTSMRILTDKAVTFGPEIIFNRLLPILLDRSLEDQERHLMIKTIDRVLYKLGDLTKPYVHKILVVAAPLLIDEDPMVRSTGQEIITNLSTVAGLKTILTVMRPDIENEDEYVRNVTSRAAAVVAKALGVNQLLPFINAACHSRKSWKARNTGIKIVQQIGILLGIGVLNHLTGLMSCIKDCLMDDHVPVRIVTAHTLSTLAENSYPYGIEVFNVVLEPLWKGIRSHRGKVLSSFLKAVGSMIPLMDPEYAGYYTTEAMRIIRREFDSPDDEMKKTILLVLQKCSAVESITPKFLREEIAPEFFQKFWVRRVALDRPLNKVVTYTTVTLAKKLGCSYTIDKLLTPLRDEAEPFRTMAVHAVTRTVNLLGTADLDERLETRLIDALLIAFQEQTNSDSIIFKGFGAVTVSLDIRMKPFLAPIVSTILNHLKHKTPLVRQHAADLCAILIPVIKNCHEFEMLNKLNIILYESLGEVYPEVLGSIINAMYCITSVMDLDKLQPPINQILPTLTPILRNKHRKVEVNTIKFVGLIGKLAPTYAPPKEWMRICFELLELLKSTNKEIRRSANATFGFIAEAIGPHDVLVALLNNLKVQERQLRVCTAVAIGIVAKVCGPYNVLPVIMNEYTTPETNVQNGVLKAMSFMFEYIGNMSKDYIYFITPLLEDALTDRDLVHRQTASNVITHLALNCSGTGHEDAFIHLMNLLIPNIFETSPHAIMRILEGLEALSQALGPGLFMNYIWAGLFHPAKNVRKAFWRVYNNMYVMYQDAMVSFYPVTPDNNEEYIEELDLVL